MRNRRKQRIIVCLLISWLLWVQDLPADKIFLKDGSVEETDRVWASEKYIHFILKGTRTVEIRFAKDIVERIERNGSDQTQLLLNSRPDQKPAKKTNPQKENEPRSKASIAGGMSSPADSASFMKGSSAEISFYDPHRKYRYWAGSESKHSTLEDALIALAKQYSRSTQWVVEHMGEENDLKIIHANLKKQLVIEENTSQDTTLEGAETSVYHRFFDADAPYPFRISADKAFKTKREAIAALADEFGRSTGWVREHMGETNDYQQIRQRLSQALNMPVKQAEAPSPQSSDTQVEPATPSMVSVPAGVPFYDPRRRQKYWSMPDARHNTLQEAISALARQYHVTEAWIEDHLGETNQLDAIHRNIQAALNARKGNPAKQ